MSEPKEPVPDPLQSLALTPPRSGESWIAFSFDGSWRGPEVIVFERSPEFAPAQRLVVRPNGAMWLDEWYVAPTAPWMRHGPAESFPRWAPAAPQVDREQALWSLVQALACGELTVPATIWNRIRREAVLEPPSPPEIVRQMLGNLPPPRVIDPTTLLRSEPAPAPDAPPANVLPFVRPDPELARKLETLAYLDGLRARVESGEVVGLFAIEDKGSEWTNTIHVRNYLELVGMLAVSQQEVVQAAFMVRDGER